MNMMSGGNDVLAECFDPYVNHNTEYHGMCKPSPNWETEKFNWESHCSMTYTQMFHGMVAKCYWSGWW